MTGELMPLIAVVGSAMLVFAIVIVAFSGSFAERVIAASGIAASNTPSRGKSASFWRIPCVPPCARRNGNCCGVTIG
ncbi:MAG: hypothetical protein R3D29_05020 [Nitratireductor sp.]